MGIGGIGQNPAVIEPTMDNGEPNGGYKDDLELPLSSFTSKTGVVLNATAGATPYWAAINTDLLGIRFNGSATVPSTSGDFIQRAMVMPGWYDAEQDSMLMEIVAGKTAAADFNTDLAIQVQMRWFQPGYAEPTIAFDAIPLGVTLTAGDSGATPKSFSDTGNTVPKRTLAAAKASNDLTRFLTYQFDLSLGVNRGTTAATKESNRIKPLSILQFQIGSDQDVSATASQFMDVLGIVLRFRRSSSMNNRKARHKNVIR